MAFYRTGSLALTNGSTAITGTGTDFISGAAIGECVQAPDGKLYEIAAVVSATSLTLATPYLGATASGQAYSIVPTQSYIRDLASQAAALVNGYQAVQDAAGAGKFTDGTVAVPGIRFTADDNTGLRRTGADAVAVVTGGVDRLTVSAAGAVAIPGTLAVAGVITGPTAAAANNTTQLATTAHVFAERTNAATLTNKTLTAPILTTPALGTPASGVLTNVTGLPIATGVAGLGTGVATFLATPTSANLAAALTDESGTGALALTISPIFTGNPTAPTPALGDSDTSLATTAFVQREKEYLPVLNQSLHVGTVVKAIVYDTSKDSDGGAWVKRCQDKSWYTEALGGSRWIGQQLSEGVARSFEGALSANFITNSDFAVDATGWTYANGASCTGTLTAVVGKGRIEKTDATAGYVGARWTVAVTAGKVYKISVSAKYISGAAMPSFMLRTGSAAPTSGSQRAGSVGVAGSDYSFSFSYLATATETLHFWMTCLSAAGIYDWDDAVIQEQAENIANVNALYQNSTDGKFYKLLATTGQTEVFRGITRDFPAVPGVIIETSREIYYDTATGAMWKVIPRTGKTLTSVAASNGMIVVSSTTGVFTERFISDAIGAPERYTTTTAPAVVSNTVNDVAITALDNAPIDPATGLPVPTIAVATAGGISVIKQDGTVVNMTVASYTQPSFVSVAWLPTGELLTPGSNIGRSAVVTIPAASTTLALAAKRSYSETDIPAMWSAGYYARSVVSLKDKVIATAINNTGVAVLKENPATPTKGMVAYITNAYNSGWMPGDIRGAYLADTVAETVTAAGDLIPNPNCSTLAGLTNTGTWTTDGSVFSNTGNTGLLTVGPVLTIGKTYAYSIEITSRTSGAIYAPYDGTALNIRSITTVGIHTGTFTATNTTLHAAYSNVFVGSVDNISVKLAEPDRSVKNNGLIVNGTLTKTAVATGAGLVAYSGFSAANYLEQPYNSQLDFGTGDFSVMGWVNFTDVSSGQCVFDRGTAASGRIALYLQSGNYLVSCSASASAIATGVAAVAGLTLCVVVRISGTLCLYINNVLVYSVANTANVTNVAATLRIGLLYTNSFPMLGSLALWRISATAPSADQIAHIYRTELPLFQPGAQCTIAGTSTAVTALAYDDATDLLHVGTSWGRTGFKDLLRVDSEATTTGALTSLSAQGGTILTGGTSAKLYVPAKYLRDELQRREEAKRALGKVPVFIDITATASQTAFILAKGYTIKALYRNGVLMRETTTGVFWTRSNDGYQETATLSVGATVGDWISLMCVRSN